MTQQRMRIRGMKQLQRTMKQLPFKVAHNIGRGAVKAGADLYRDHLQAEAPRLIPPNDAIVLDQEIHSKRRNSRGKLEARATVNAGEAYHFHLVEFGTSNSPAYPFARPIWDREQDNILKRIADYIRVRLKKVGVGGSGL